jgi:electron transport complex protein RnfD
VAFVLPVHMPWYVPVMASFFAIAVVKQAFGGLGCNIWNPALMGRAFVLAAWGALVTASAGWPAPFHYRMQTAKAEASAAASAPQLDATTAATPLTKAKKQLQAFNRGKTGDLAAPRNRHEAENALAKLQDRGSTPLADLFVGRVGGCIGEVSALALLVGGAALIALGYVKWHVPAFFIGTAALLSWALPIPVQGEQARYFVWFAGRPLFEVLAGGLFLGAFFMATDMVTSPVTKRGLIVFAVGCGVLTVLIRRYGGYPEGVCYAILLMNTATPLIDRHTKPKVFGQRETQ